MTNMDKFTKEWGLAADADRLPAYAADVEAEMRRGLRGDKGTLQMLPTYLDPDRIAKAVPGGASSVVIDAGGTNLRIAAVELGGAAPVIRSYEKYRTPGYGRRVSAEEFFDQIADRLAPVLDRSDKIGFCFSYPAEILPNRDARILRFTKEINVDGAAGTVIGDALRDALKAKGLPHEKRVIVLNDTVAAQLGAMADGGQGSHAGFILGTGVNASYTEKNENILKEGVICAEKGDTIMNMEAGGYDGFPLSEADRRFIAASEDPEKQHFEKMVSGAYQCGALLEWIRFAAEKGCFSGEFRGRLETLGEIPAGEADRFYLSPENEGVLSGLCAREQDAGSLLRLVEAFVDRAAFMTAAVLAGVLTRLGDAAGSPENPARISAEGSVFYNARLMRQRIDAYMAQAAARMGLHSTFVKTEQATLLGTAVAALIN
ncbi:MAG: hypothetical protein LBT26_11615 [Clostridiales Family XIII bacterium]|jgi:hexokinase|nr:hypothetical protein [Clostridiales Family XIII bacterium]